MSASNADTKLKPWTLGNSLIGFDPDRRRIWLGGQRLHHGVTGMALAATGLAGIAAHRLNPLRGLGWTMLGASLVAHDWHDRALWFERGPGHQD